MVLDVRKLGVAVFGEERETEREPTVEEVLRVLKPQAGFVLGMRYSEGGMSLREVGEVTPRVEWREGAGGVGVTRERVRQIEAKALRRLRHPRVRIPLWGKDSAGGPPHLVSRGDGR